MKTVLMIGGAGFMGCNFSEYFLKKGYKVVSYDIKESRIKDSNLVNVIGNSKDTNKMKEIFSNHKIDFVIYTLTSFWIVDSNELYQELVLENLAPIIDLLNIMKENNVNKFIYISSGGSIYGQSNKPISEDAEKLPVSFYGWIKEAAESYIRYIARTNDNFKYIIFRPSNVYGKYQQLNRIIGVALKNAYIGEEMNIFGDINTQKDYIHIDDFSEIVLTLIEKEKWNDVYNIGSGEATSTKEILEYAQEITGNKMKINYKETKTGDINYSVLNVDKVKNILGKSKFLNTFDGMKDMFKYVKSEIDREDK